MFILSVVLIFCLQFQAQAKVDEPEIIGNFLLPASQQPGACFCFGQNVVDKGDMISYGNLNQLGGPGRNITLIVPGVVYGIRDYLSLFVAVPLFADIRQGNNTSSGISDIFMQLEYTYLNNTTSLSSAQGTIVGSLFLPTGSARKSPKTGFGSPSVFLGTTYAYMSHWWAFWIQGGALLTTKSRTTKYGNTFLYQAGFEKCVYSDSGWTGALIVEFFGLLEEKDRICGAIDSNSGGNSIWIGPSLWASSKTWIVNIGAATPILQQLNGTQYRSRYFVNLNIGYKF